MARRGESMTERILREIESRITELKARGDQDAFPLIDFRNWLKSQPPTEAGELSAKFLKFARGMAFMPHTVQSWEMCESALRDAADALNHQEERAAAYESLWQAADAKVASMQAVVDAALAYKKLDDERWESGVQDDKLHMAWIEFDRVVKALDAKLTRE